METINEAYFEPGCRWKRGNDSDSIDIELDGFKAEDVKASFKQIEEGKCMISITAEFPRRLRKNIEISDECYDSEQISALFSNGNLNLILPKKKNKLEVSMPKLEFTKSLQELMEDTKNKISSALEYSYSNRNIVAFGFMLMATGFFAYRYYTECNVTVG